MSQGRPQKPLPRMRHEDPQSNPVGDTDSSSDGAEVPREQKSASVESAIGGILFFFGVFDICASCLGLLSGFMNENMQTVAASVGGLHVGVLMCGASVVVGRQRRETK